MSRFYLIEVVHGPIGYCSCNHLQRLETLHVYASACDQHLKFAPEFHVGETSHFVKFAELADDVKYQLLLERACGSLNSESSADFNNLIKESSQPIIE
jgi:hypothetical protein